MAALASDWLRHFSTSPLKPLNGIKRNLTGSKISTSSTKFVFFRLIRKTKWPTWPLIGWDIFDFQILFDTFIVLRWATVARLGLLFVLSFCCQWMLILYNETETTNYLMNYIKNVERSEPKIYQNPTFLSLNPAVYCNFVIFQISLKVTQKFRNL